MANEQVNIPSLVVILVLSGLIVRYLFFSSPVGTSRGSSHQASHRGGGDASLAALRARELAAERILQMFPQVDRRAVLWDLQRTGGSLTATTERILAGRLETPPVTFQPPPPTSTTTSQQQSAQHKQPDKPAQPNLITRYNLQERLAASRSADSSDAESTGSGTGASASKNKAWSSNRDERQALLQKRRDQMILEARRKMEAKIATEKAARGAQAV